VKILVVDDHPLIVQALSQLLPRLTQGIATVSAGDPMEAVAVLDADPDIGLVLLDLALPGARGLDFLADLMLDYPGVAVVVLSATHDDDTVAAALAAGARGFIPKTARPDVLLEALRNAIEGAQAVRVSASAAPVGDGVHIGGDALGLTPRQADVLKLLVQGKPNKIICRQLRLSEGTVKVHVSAILKRLNVQSRTQAVAELARRGISTHAITHRRANEVRDIASPRS
jgi:DNA-binding NarL/FixJ family response regulator